MMRHLSDEALGSFMVLYNKVWVKGKLPKLWKTAVVVPVRKPGKDSSQPSNYRPIALMS